MIETFIFNTYFIGRGIGKTTTQVVTHKYGDQVGKATEVGFNAVGNVGKVTQAYKQGAYQVVGEATSKKEN